MAEPARESQCPNSLVLTGSRWRPCQTTELAFAPVLLDQVCAHSTCAFEILVVIVVDGQLNEHTAFPVGPSSAGRGRTRRRMRGLTRAAAPPGKRRGCRNRRVLSPSADGAAPGSAGGAAASAALPGAAVLNSSLRGRFRSIPGSTDPQVLASSSVMWILAVQPRRRLFCRPSAGMIHDVDQLQATNSRSSTLAHQARTSRLMFENGARPRIPIACRWHGVRGSGLGDGILTGFGTRIGRSEWPMKCHASKQQRGRAAGHGGGGYKGFGSRIPIAYDLCGSRLWRLASPSPCSTKP